MHDIGFVEVTRQRIVGTGPGRFSFAESGEGPPRLYLHSLLTDRTAFDPVTEGLGGRSVMADLPGFGETDQVGPSIDGYADRVAAFARSQGLGFGDGLVLIGNGLGAFVALGTLIRHPGLAERAVLVGCGTAFPDGAKGAFSAMIEAAESGGMESVVPIALRRIFTEDFISRHPDMADERARVLRRTSVEAFTTACSALAAMDYSGLAATVATPTLVVVGEHDQATPPRMAEELHAELPNSDLVRLPGIAHAPQLQDPRGFIGTVRPFMEAQIG